MEEAYSMKYHQKVFLQQALKEDIKDLEDRLCILRQQRTLNSMTPSQSKATETPKSSLDAISSVEEYFKMRGKFLQDQSDPRSDPKTCKQNPDCSPSLQSKPLFAFSSRFQKGKFTLIQEKKVA